MTISVLLRHRLAGAMLAVVVLAATSVSASPSQAQTVAFRQAVAEASADDQDIAGFYRDRAFQPIWTGSDDADRARRTELLEALRSADRHGLPAAVYDVEGLVARMAAAGNSRDLGALEVELSRLFLSYARDLQTGILVPADVNPLIVRDVPYRLRQSYLRDLAASDPNEIFRAIAPQSREYADLMRHKLRLERLVAEGGWGAPLRIGKIEAGDSGPDVVALRDRLVRMGYLERSASSDYDAAMQSAVLRLQANHGLAQDGVVGPGTLAEINAPVTDRLASVIVAMERERWTNMGRGARHVEVNLADFTARIIDAGRVTFETRSVIGARNIKRQSPEFSDEMEFMVINPSWFVPRSIATGEYLPELQQDSNAVDHLIITDRSGQQIDRAEVDFSQFTPQTFPFAMRQPPSRSNALGLVKFMFPNRHNIYLHDTPAKSLFARETRAYSHGCIRLADPFEFAYALLAAQSDDPVGLFQANLARGQEVQLNLETHVPVHLIYRTAFANERGEIRYRRDIYNRDTQIWAALRDAGVVLRTPES